MVCEGHNLIFGQGRIECEDTHERERKWYMRRALRYAASIIRLTYFLLQYNIPVDVFAVLRGAFLLLIYRLGNIEVALFSAPHGGYTELLLQGPTRNIEGASFLPGAPSSLMAGPQIV